jgi:hypothetical protein
VSVEGGSLEGAELLLEEAFAARLGAPDWVRWRNADDRGPGRA